MADDEKLSEADAVLVNVLALLIASTCIAEPGRKVGFDEALGCIRDAFLKDYKGKAAGLVELIRDRAAHFQQGEALLNKLLQVGSTSSARN
jgi:hypothetical protein